MASKFLSYVQQGDNSVVVLRTYRHLLRATFLAFQGDTNTLTASRQFARESFEQSRRLPSGSTEAAQAIAHAQGVTHILRQNVVQGKMVGEDKYKLNIHEHIERGDNASAKKMQGSVKSFKDIKNAAF